MLIFNNYIVQNRKKTFNFSKHNNQTINKFGKIQKDYDQEEWKQNLSKYSDSSQMFQMANTMSQRQHEIKQIELKYKMLPFTNQNKSSSYSSYVTGSTFNSSITNVGMMVIGGNLSNNTTFNNKLLIPKARRGKTSANRKHSKKPHLYPIHNIN